MDKGRISRRRAPGPGGSALAGFSEVLTNSREKFATAHRVPGRNSKCDPIVNCRAVDTGCGTRGQGADNAFRLYRECTGAVRPRSRCSRSPGHSRYDTLYEAAREGL